MSEFLAILFAVDKKIGGCNMDGIQYLSVQEISDSWGISKRRIQNLCANNRIPGAVRIDNIWAIPYDALKPRDERFHKNVKAEVQIESQMKKARKSIKNIVDTSITELQDLGLSVTDALYHIIVYFAMNLLNQYIIDNQSCRILCEYCFNYKLNTTISKNTEQNILKFISNYEMCLDDSLSWVYQFGSKKSVAFKYKDTQFFTEKYMITTLVDSLKLDLDSKIIDPACGGANFLLYLFDVLIKECVYDEIDAIGKVNLVFDNLLGYEIDRFLAYIASFNLKLKALSFIKKYTEIDVSVFKKIHTRIYYPQTDSISGFLDTEWHFHKVVCCDNDKILTLANLFNGVNVIVTNPPFQTIKRMPSEQKKYLQKYYQMSKCDMCNAFIERIMAVLPTGGRAAMVTQNSWMYLDSYTPLRKKILTEYTVNDIWELGSDAFYDLSGEKANVALVIYTKNKPKHTHQIRLRNFRNMSIEQTEAFLKDFTEEFTSIKQEAVLSNLESRFDMISTEHLKTILTSYEQYKTYAIPMQGTSTGDAKNLIDYYWKHIGDDDWVVVSKGGGYSRYKGLNLYCVKWGKNGEYIRNTKGSAIRNSNYFDQTQLVFSDTGTAGLNVRVLLPGQIFVASGPGIRVNRGSVLSHLAFLNSRFAAFYVRLISPKLTIAAGYIGQIPVTSNILNSKVLETCAKICLECKTRRLSKRASNIEFSYFIHNSKKSIREESRIWFDEDLKDELTQLLNEQKIEDEIAAEMCLTTEDKLAIDSLIGRRIVFSYDGENNQIILEKDISEWIGYDCLLKRTKANKKSIGSDGIIEFLSQLKEISCEYAYSFISSHYEFFEEKYIALYLHSLIMSGLNFLDQQSKSKTHSLSSLIIDIGIKSEIDRMLVTDWVEKQFNKVHYETFFEKPIVKYDSLNKTFLWIEEG